MAHINTIIQDQMAYVTISNPGKRNALNSEMWQSLCKQFQILNDNQELRCIILKGAENDFASGADIQEFATVRNTLADGMRYHNQIVLNAITSISECLHPVIAAIDGSCVGGGLAIALACDIRIASTSAKFGMPVNHLGFPLAPMELKSLMSVVGKANTLEILLEGRIFNSIEAKQKGFIHKIADDIDAETAISAKYICAGAPLAARLNKKMVRRLSFSAERLTDEEFKTAFSFLETQDYQEGVFAFLSKTTPQFTGK